MLSARAPLSVKNEKSLSGQVTNMSLDKENTVRLQRTWKTAVSRPEETSDVFIHSTKCLLVSEDILSFVFQPPSLNTTRILASKTARKIFDEPAVSPDVLKASGLCVEHTDVLLCDHSPR